MKPYRIVIAALSLAALMHAEVQAAAGDPVPVALGPYLQFVSRTEARVTWETAEPAPTLLTWGVADVTERRIEDAERKTLHTVTLAGLADQSRYLYRVPGERIRPGGGNFKPGETPLEVGETPTHRIDTAFNYCVPSFPADADPFPADEHSAFYAAAADFIIEATGITKGYCLDYGVGSGRLAWEIARRTELNVIGVSDDAERIAALRERFSNAGLYGSRITFQKCDLAALPYPDMFVNLIISDEFAQSGRLPGDAEEVLHKLRPAGGTAALVTMPGASHAVPGTSTGALLARFREVAGENEIASATGRGPVEGSLSLRVIRPALKGAGSWTHMYGDAAQTSCSGDELIYGKTGENIEVQWMGQPGSDAMMDRQARNQGPLGANGRVFTQGDDRVIAQDSYNGAILWSLEIPDMRRVNVKVDTSNSCLDDDHLYLAVHDRCWRLDAQTGRRVMTYDVTDGEDPLYDWGYCASDGARLFGSGVRTGSIFRRFYGPEDWYEKPFAHGSEKVLSDYLFAMTKETGRREWTYRGGRILNPTISMGGGRIYFVESRDEKAMASESGQIGDSELYQALHLVALDVATGEKLWERPVDYGDRPPVIYLSFAEGRVVVQASVAQNKSYNLHTYDAATGEPGWKHSYDWRRDDHGHHLQHPVIVGDKLIAQPEYFDLATGAPLGDTPERTKCGTMTASARALHYRDYYDEVWDLASNETSEWRGLRSSCWLGLISADGLILSTESGGGCSCNFPVQLSLGYRTKNDY